MAFLSVFFANVGLLLFLMLLTVWQLVLWNVVFVGISI